MCFNLCNKLNRRSFIYVGCHLDVTLQTLESILKKKKTFIKPRFPSFIALTHVEVLIVLYTDDAISTDTLNMRREVGTEIKRNRW